MTKHIEISTGDVTLVSDVDYDYLMQFNWFLSRSSRVFYPVKYNPTKHMHQVVATLMNLTVPYAHEIDHKDRDPMNNQRDNLRILSRTLNCHNTKIRIDNTSNIRGVHYAARRRKWVVKFTINRITHFLGEYINYEEAVAARLKAEEQHLKGIKS